MNLSFTSNFTFNTTKYHFSTLALILIIKTGSHGIDEEQAVFEQLTLSDYKKQSSTALKTFNNYIIIVTNSSDKLEYYDWDVFVSVAYFWVNSTGCSGEFHVAFEHFQNLENLISNILREKLHISCLVSLE